MTEEGLQGPVKYGGTPTLYLLSTDTISGPCVGFPNYLEEEEAIVNEFYFLKPVSDWANTFIKLAREHTSGLDDEAKAYWGGSSDE